MNLPQLQIRRMSAADVDHVIEIADGLDQAPHWARRAWVAAIDPENGLRRIALVAREAGGVPFGFVLASVLPPEAELESIGAIGQTQRRGVGRQLFAALLEELRATHITELVLEVRSSNETALGFYRALGFAETGRRPRYYADPEEDAILMKLRMGDGT
jgi:[ribosomal protein S18]-alanine N-acetyltransferase